MRNPKMLDDAECRRVILDRLSRVRPETPRLWGKMTSPQMICHLTDSFLGVMGDRPVEVPPPAFGYRIVKWFALNGRMQWPHGVPTRPEVDQLGGGGTKPAQFEADLLALRAAMDKFTGQPRSFAFKPHPIFQTLTQQEWMRWGYLHMDHHLRQFGC